LAPLPGTLFFVLGCLHIQILKQSVFIFNFLFLIFSKKKLFFLFFFINSYNFYFFNKEKRKKKKYIFLVSLCLQGGTLEELDPWKIF